MVKAIFDVSGKDYSKYVKIEFALGPGYYVTAKGGLEITKDFLDKVKARMTELCEQDLPIVKSTISTAAARELFKNQGMKDKDELFKFRRSSTVNVYELDGYYDYFYGFMFPSTRYIKYFDLVEYKDGFVLMLPTKDEPNAVSEFKPMDKIFDALMTTTDWGEKMGIDTVGGLNMQICKGSINDVIMVQEALQERRIAEIAREIASRKGVKFVMIAGPSSSGKTSFALLKSIRPSWLQ